MEPKRIAIYTRVSTSNQSVENQRHDLRGVVEARHWHVAKEYTDEGISGSKGRGERPALDALLKAAVRGEFDVLAVWSIDRLGRSLQHLVETVNELKAVGIDLYIHQQAIDTSSPAGKLAFSVFGALAEYERELIRERVRAGLDRARRNGTVLSTALYLAVARHLHTFHYYALAIALAPLALLRTDAAINWGLKKYYAINGMGKRLLMERHYKHLVAVAFVLFVFVVTIAWGFIYRIVSVTYWFFRQPVEALRQMPRMGASDPMC